MEALKYIAPEARVLRSGQETKISAKELVPGYSDLNTGDIIPADLRLLEVYQWKLKNQSPDRYVKKILVLSELNTGLGDRETCIYMGTIVTRGIFSCCN